jgi:hypothetical protein
MTVCGGTTITLSRLTTLAMPAVMVVRAVALILLFRNSLTAVEGPIPQWFPPPR